MSFPKQPSELGLYYATGEMREAAAFVKPPDSDRWLYHSRGTADEAYRALLGRRPGFIGGVADFAPEEVRVTLDQPSWGDTDRKDLCWGGPSLSVSDFMDWYAEARLREVGII